MRRVQLLLNTENAVLSIKGHSHVQLNAIYNANRHLKAASVELSEEAAILILL